MPPPRTGFMRQRLKQAARQRGDTVKLHWTTVTGGTVDPVYHVTTGGTETPRSEEIKALVHFPDYASHSVRNFAVIQVGDLIVDFPADAQLDGRAGLSFEIQGIRYRQKETGEDLAKAWDAVVGGVRLARTLLLTPAK
jgi:hypothetical protein